MSASTVVKAHYNDVKSPLMEFRLDNKIMELESRKGKNRGVVFPFARGLRFSSLLIYKIRELLLGSNLTANWGQIVREDGEYSNECDIIIHVNGHEYCWNGEGRTEKVMDFKFVAPEKVKAVISCKSYIKTNTIEKEYFQNLSNYISKIWLFAECCPKSSVKTIRKNAQAAGYEFFWHLYTFEKKKGETKDALNEWEDFVKTVKTLANP